MKSQSSKIVHKENMNWLYVVAELSKYFCTNENINTYKDGKNDKCNLSSYEGRCFMCHGWYVNEREGNKSLLIEKNYDWVYLFIFFLILWNISCYYTMMYPSIYPKRKQVGWTELHERFYFTCTIKLLYSHFLNIYRHTVDIYSLSSTNSKMKIWQI